MPSARGPLPRGVFTTRSTLPDEMRSTASSPTPSWPVHASSPASAHRPRRPAMPSASSAAAVPAVATSWKPSSANRRAATRPAALSRSASERNTVPAQRQAVARGGLALHEREPERAVDAHHLAGRAHLGSEQGVDLGEPVEREHGFLHRDVAAVARRVQQAFGAQLRERGADHHTRRDLRERDAGRLADERHRAAGARVRLDARTRRRP